MGTEEPQNEELEEKQNIEEQVPEDPGERLVGGKKSLDPTTFFTIDIAKDLMSAHLIIDAESIKLDEVSSPMVQQFLSRSGLDPDLIDYTSINYVFAEINRMKSGQSKPGIIKTLVSRGKQPEKGRDGWLKYFFPINQRVVIKDDGSADFRNIDKYVSIKTGEKIATVFHGLVGKPGRDVKGGLIQAPPIDRPKLIVGKNINSQDREEYTELTEVLKYTDYLATCDGVLYAQEGSISVSPELEINSNVGLSTGNITFDGTINIRGTVEDGSKVESTGNLFVSENIETSQVVVGGDLMVKGGIKTNSKGVIKVAGSLRSKFIENSVLEVDGDVYVDFSILNSKIYTLGSVIMTGKSNAIIGSEITCYGGLSAHNLGSNAGLNVHIETGVHYKNERLFIELQEQIKLSEKELDKVIPKIQQMKIFIQKSRGKLDNQRKLQFQKVFEEYKKRENMHKMLVAKHEDLKTGRFNLEKVNLVVRNTAFPGTVIKYRRQVERISKEQSAFMMNFFPGQDHAAMTAISGKHKKSKAD
ncbi:MAG: DUF342 domain-containing protein [Leptospiraceae bacterium]|nr:DUF342 domain-containing protein [Leptospiraceae bacterium]MCP5503204.1 DUF342 domain-containing protein [Leptospiraceae bacterium]